MYKTGCWIGLRDQYGTGWYQWIEASSMNDISYRDWRRTETLNRDLSDGFIDNGKRCVFTFPWQDDPLIREEGSWSMDPCNSKRAFVCQHFQPTINHKITVNGVAFISNTASFSGGTFLFQQYTEINSLNAGQSTEIFVWPLSSSTAGKVQSIILTDGSSIKFVGGSISGSGNIFIGEQVSYGLQPQILVDGDAKLSFDSAKITVNAEFMVPDGTINLDYTSTLLLQQVRRKVKILINYI